MKKILTTQPVDIALRSMDADGVQQVEAWFDHLRNWETDEYVRTHSRRLDGVKGVSVLRTTSDLVIFFRMSGNTITILDLAKTPTIRAFETAAAGVE